MSAVGVTRAPVVVLAGGGTGGHVFPMIAVADALRAEAEVRVVYAGTKRGIETRVVPARGDELELLDVLPIKGQGAWGALRGAARAAATLPAARKLVKRLDAQAVLAVGGYASGPVALAAWTAGRPVAILAPDVVLGLTNRWLLPFARRAYVAFAETEQAIGADRALRTGVPLRGLFSPKPYVPEPGRLSVLVLGGSLGARALNEVLPRALAEVARSVAGLTVVHQTGREHHDVVEGHYRELGLSDRARVVPFLDDVATELERADLVVGRAGASSVAELCAVGRASILIPLSAVRVHQDANALALSSSGGAIAITQANATAERLEREIAALAADGARRTRMADAARAQGRPSAARDVARDLLALAGIPRRRSSPSEQFRARAPAPPERQGAHV